MKTHTVDCNPPGEQRRSYPGSTFDSWAGMGFRTEPSAADKAEMEQERIARLLLLARLASRPIPPGRPIGR